MPVDRALELGIQIADALAFAHAHDLVHRDVKPQNVLLDGAGDAKVTDFGIARSLDVERGVTQTGTVLGTSNYLSPEQASGKPTSPATDVYSLGVVLYELLTGEVPFRGDNLVVVAMKHVTERPPNLPDQRADVPPRLAQAVERALEKDPARRFASMDAFANELRRCRDELGGPETERTLVRGTPIVGAPRPARKPRARRRRGHLPTLLALAGLVLIAVVVAVIVFGGSGNGTRHHHGGGLLAVGDARRASANYDPQRDARQAREHGVRRDGWESVHGLDDAALLPPRSAASKPGDSGSSLDAGRELAASSEHAHACTRRRPASRRRSRRGARRTGRSPPTRRRRR